MSQLILSPIVDTRQPGTVFKKLDTRQSEILTNFLGIARLIPLRTQDICLETSSDCKYCIELKVEATVEFGHRVKSQCVRHLENIKVLTHRVNRDSRCISTEIINETSPEYLVFGQKCQAILNKGFVLLWTPICLAVGNSRPICTKYLI